MGCAAGGRRAPSASSFQRGNSRPGSSRSPFPARSRPARSCTSHSSWRGPHGELLRLAGRTSLSVADLKAHREFEQELDLEDPAEDETQPGKQRRSARAGDDRPLLHAAASQRLKRCVPHQCSWPPRVLGCKLEMMRGGQVCRVRRCGGAA